MADYKLKFMIGRGRTFYDYSELVSSVTVSGRKGAAPRSISVVLFDSEGYAMKRASVDCGSGQTCVLYLDGKEIFRGLLMTETKSSARTAMQIRYLNTSLSIIQITLPSIEAS